jgi:hypothetical protein
MFTKTLKGTPSPITGSLGPAPIELAIGAKHSVAGADFCKEGGDGSYTLTFPSAENYSDFLDELATTCSEDKAIIADALARHGA